MSEDIVIDPKRQEALTRIIMKLHAGTPVGEVKKEFARLIVGVSAAEIAAMEQALIDNGMPVEEVQRLCEVHEAALADLSKLIVHYARKENQLFPYLEKHKFTGPSRVMWGKHDEIRELFKETEAALSKDQKSFRKAAKALKAKILKMIFMEQHILIPESNRRLSEREWAEIRMGEDAIGFAWVKPASMYDAGLILARTGGLKYNNLQSFIDATPAAAVSVAPVPDKIQKLLELSTGLVPLKTLDLALKTLPIDISIVDEEDRVLYYSDAPHRIFPRSPGVIGRSVQNCHPQKSVDMVNKILAAFKKGEKDKAQFWIEMGGKFILIEYYAIRDSDRTYLGTLEVSQDLTDLRALSGQRRLLDWE
ncbi:MAG: hypothetical protein FD137_1622 [Spirochaetes bacterium]|nr:MAG: hypothetical protein FD137_1622 [Spirochaetota bacterium]